MRFEKPIYFCLESKPVYSSETGDYDEPTVTEDKAYARVTEAGLDTLRLIYAEIQQGALIVRLQNHYTKPFSYIRIGDKKYAVRLQRKQRVKHIFVVSEVQ